MLMSAPRAPTTAAQSALTPSEGSSVGVPMGTNLEKMESHAQVGSSSSRFVCCDLV